MSKTHFTYQLMLIQCCASLLLYVVITAKAAAKAQAAANATAAATAATTSCATPVASLNASIATSATIAPASTIAVTPAVDVSVPMPSVLPSLVQQSPALLAAAAAAPPTMQARVYAAQQQSDAQPLAYLANAAAAVPPLPDQSRDASISRIAALERLLLTDASGDEEAATDTTAGTQLFNMLMRACEYYYTTLAVLISTTLRQHILTV
jgi:hypothetical protein